jgi:magnesium transporter
MVDERREDGQGSTAAGPRQPLARSLTAPVRGLSRRVVRPSRARRSSPGTDGAAVRDSAIVDCALYEDGRRQGGVVPLSVALETAHRASGGGEVAGGNFLWIGLHEPTAEEFENVAAEFALHPLAVEDAVHAHQRPKLEIYGDIVFAVLKTVRYVDPTEVIEVGEVMLFLGPDFVITVRHGEGSALGDVRRDLEARPDLLRVGPSAVLYAVADRIVDDYGLAIDGVATDIEEIEGQVFSGERADRAERIYKLKREILAFRRAVAPLAAPLDRLAHGRVPGLDPSTAAYFRDVQDHVLRAAEQIDGFNELLNGVLDANIAGVSMRQNEDMRKITAWVAILAWATWVAGVYGMNFDHMPELHWLLGYPFALALMVVPGLLLYRAFRRNDWL